ncbi:Blue copper protein [Nymphaea thermarum]|nr:Blue copper protein [Nymphaea thermarum]
MASGSLVVPGFFVISCISLLCVRHIEAAVYTVGDDDEWSLEGDYDKWSQKYNFTVGDTLEFKVAYKLIMGSSMLLLFVFRYVKSQHNVYIVRQRTYMSCNTSTGVLNIYTSGNDRIVLRARKYWFICGITDHCSGGMKFGLNLLGANRRITNQTTESPSAAPLPSPSGANNHGLTRPTSLLVIILLILINSLF